MGNEKITIETSIDAPVDKVWKYFSEPEHITKWNQASDDWHSPSAENDLRVDGKFTTHMAAKDGSASFNFSGTYTEVTEHERIEYVLEDDRKVLIVFEAEGKSTKMTETFDAETSNPVEMQKGGWQAILDSFKKYTEEN